MDQKEDTITEGQDKMYNTRIAVAAEQGGEPVELSGFIDGKASEYGTQPHHDDGGIGDLLRPIIFDLRGRGLTKVQVMEQDEPRLLKGMPVGKEIAPFAGEQRIEHIDQSVEKEYPHEHKMKGHAFGQTTGQVERLVKGFREKAEEDGMTQVNLVDVVSPIDQESAPDHDSQDREVDPMHPADRQRMFGDYFLHINPIRAKIVNSGEVQSLHISRFYHKCGWGRRVPAADGVRRSSHFANFARGEMQVRYGGGCGRGGGRGGGPS